MPPSPRRFEGEKLIIATHNRGKLREFQAMLKPYVKTILSAGELGLPEPIEDGGTFAENAILKARAAAHASQSIALADDSGLCVNALNGAPGIFSARWAGPKKDFFDAMRRVHEDIGENSDRSAYFVCALALAWPDGHVETVEGRVNGDLVWPPRGASVNVIHAALNTTVITHAHGYDPMFVPKGDTRTFAEMSAEEKDAVSHRGKAVRELIKRYFA